MTHEGFPSSQAHESEDLHERVSETVRHDLGGIALSETVVLFRAGGSIEGKEGVVHGEGGRMEYVASTENHLPVFGLIGQDAAAEAAVRALAPVIGSVYALQVNREHVNPASEEGSDDVMIIADGAPVVAYRVPPEDVKAYLHDNDRPSQAAFTKQVTDRLFPPDSTAN